MTQSVRTRYVGCAGRGLRQKRMFAEMGSDDYLHGRFGVKVLME